MYLYNANNTGIQMNVFFKCLCSTWIISPQTSCHTQFLWCEGSMFVVSTCQTSFNMRRPSAWKCVTGFFFFGRRGAAISEAALVFVWVTWQMNRKVHQLYKVPAPHVFIKLFLIMRGTILNVTFQVLGLCRWIAGLQFHHFFTGSVP